MRQHALSIWLAEGQASQRDMLASLQALKSHAPQALKIIASHRHHRPEITDMADIAYQEPEAETERIDFVLQQARRHQTRVLLSGRNGKAYEAQRAAFAQAGIRLFTGAQNEDSLHLMDNKAAFAAFCQARHIPVADGWEFHNIEELQELLAQHGQQALCVKPVSGIFAQGFWRLDSGDETWDSFSHLYHTEAKKIHLPQFIQAYQDSLMVQTRPIPMLLMPYLSGREYSIDVLCERGESLLAISRYKEGSVQHIGADESVLPLVEAVIAAIGCDGIVSVQSKGDAQGRQHILEINARPSGGISYGNHSGVDIAQTAFAYWLGWLSKAEVKVRQEQIQTCCVRPISGSVKISG